MADFGGKKNPFEFDAAGNLAIEDLLEIFVEDHNYSRFICAPRNVFLVGERGSGKSMMLRYNEYRSRRALSVSKGLPLPNDFIGMLVECKSPLYARDDDNFVGAEKHKARLISEHLLVTEIGQALATSLSEFQRELSEEENRHILTTLKLYFDARLTAHSEYLFEALRLYFRTLNIEAQRDLNSFHWAREDKEYVTLSSALIPILEELSMTECFSDSHFMIMIDDAQNLNTYQKSILNTWITYRNQSLFSFKVGFAKSEYEDYRTLTASPILEGHDYILLDMEKPFQNASSDYGQFARDVVSKRLGLAGFDVTSPKAVDEFFPASKSMNDEIDSCTEHVKSDYTKQNPNATSKQVNDHGYKYGRAKYFRDRKAKASLPQYSGFDTISHLSTGVIRECLKPCYFMFDKMVSEGGEKEFNSIPANVQAEVIKQQSSYRWQKVEELHRYVKDCTEEQSRAIYNLLEKLGQYFVERLLKHSSEPRVLTFVISDQNNSDMEYLNQLFKICRSTGLIYMRRGVSRDKGKRETFYTPDRMLWPEKGLDPIGQHGRASIPAGFLVLATKGKSIPLPQKQSTETEQHTLELGTGG